jgi:Enoyl-CoA hydratase/carnithine racemase
MKIKDNPMEMLNPHCGVDRDSRGVVRLSICNAGSLNILGSAVINGVREGFETLAGDQTIRAVILAGQSEKSMIGGADIKEMAKLDQTSAEAFITRLRDLCEAVRQFPAPGSHDCPAGASAVGWKSPPPAISGLPPMMLISACPRSRSDPLGDPRRTVPRLIGWGRARWLVMTAENIDAPTALAWGLSTSSHLKAASTTRSSTPSRRCSNAGPRRCGRRRRCCGNGKNYH